MLKGALLLTSIVCFSSFTWAIYTFFEAPGGIPKQMRRLGGLGLVAFIFELVGLVTGSDTLMQSLGEVLLILSLGLFWKSVASVRGNRLGIAYAAIQPKSVVRNGPYRWVRHPFYSAYMLFWIGGAVASAIPLLIVVPLVMGSFYYFVARAEEQQLLASRFGASYADYMRQTGMFLPAVTLSRSKRSI
jgi:protein-S-isoprenylcysteine O-methyltransferase Ste14